MKKAAFIVLCVLAAIGAVRVVLGLITEDVGYVYACRADEPITGCRTYPADIRREWMDGMYVIAMHPTDTTKAITFEPISQDSSYAQGCWLGIKKGPNGLAYNVCKSSDGEWIILEAQTERRLVK